MLTFNTALKFLLPKVYSIGIGGLAVLGGTSLLGSWLGKEGSEDAAQAQKDAAGLSTAEQRRQFNLTRADMAPYREAGVDALNTLASYGRSPIDPSSYIPESDIPEFDATQFDIFKDPSYEWRLGEQNRAINRNAAGYGHLMSGNRLEELMGRSGEMASQEYGNAFSRMLDDYQIRRANEAERYGRGVDDYGRAYGQETDYLNRLANISGIGQTAATDTGRFGADASRQISGNIMDAGRADAAGILGRTSAWQNVLGDLSSLYARYQPGSVTTDYSIPMISRSY